ncbi:hypothetical protein GJU39_09215 [Pedobacter petrophilus]|uniref:Lipocalin-like domain-containing protein n=1 Tax=Pedobacter petrophilus TaxID=1908241 RepID=A0A7K0FXF5_9SPHI|nr:hypothetical protein [Pedobacter petrophilus]MRX76268.1 hypothetical protein [Pedobacter petrophilus]
MKFNLTSTKAFIGPVVVITLILFLFSCKKDQLIVDQDKNYVQVDFKSDQNNPFLGGWGLKLSPDGTADVVPSGDIYYRGTYKINGETITVKTDQETFKFEILSETDIKEKKYGTLMRLSK